MDVQRGMELKKYKPYMGCCYIIIKQCTTQLHSVSCFKIDYSRDTAKVMTNG
jgi:hypothetical protein